MNKAKEESVIHFQVESEVEIRFLFGSDGLGIAFARQSV